MFQTLERVNAALARVQPELPPTVKITANRLTFAAFPIMGYSLTSDTVPQTRLWELATYDLKPRLNRMKGVSTIVVQGGQVPEFEVRPDPAKLLETQVNVPTILDAIGRSNLIDSPGLFEENHQLVLSLVSGQARTQEDISEHRREDDAARRTGSDRRHRDRGAVGQAGLHGGDGEHQARGPAERLPAAGQQHRGGRRRGARRNREHPPRVAEGRRAEAFLRSIGSGERFDQERARCGAHRPGAGVADHGAVSARLGHFARRRPGDSRRRSP